jgi:hypothetical protein
MRDRVWWKNPFIVVPAVVAILVLYVLALAPLIFTVPLGDAPPAQMPTPAPIPTSTPLADIDRILEGLDLGSIAFNTPTTLKLGDLAVIQLLLSTEKSIEQLQDAIAAIGEREGAAIRVSNQMQARLSGSGFKIEAITPETQAVSALNVTEWKWEIEPTKRGPQRLHLTLSVLIYVEGDRTPRAIRTFEKL